MKLKAIVILLSMLSIPAMATDSEVRHHWQAGAGPGYFSGVNTSELIGSWRFGYGWQMTSDFDMAVMADWAYATPDTDTHYFTLNLSGDYNFSQEKTSPFVTADIGYGSIHAHWNCLDPSCESPSDDAAGVAFGVGGGYKFFRESLFQLAILGRYDLVLANTRYGTPMKTSVQAVVYY